MLSWEPYLPLAIPETPEACSGQSRPAISRGRSVEVVISSRETPEVGPEITAKRAALSRCGAEVAVPTFERSYEASRLWLAGVNGVLIGVPFLRLNPGFDAKGLRRRRSETLKNRQLDVFEVPPDSNEVQGSGFEPRRSDRNKASGPHRVAWQADSPRGPAWCRLCSHSHPTA
jgi:hypothetical protein